MPPFAEPSSFVSATPVTPAVSPNRRACCRPFCPVVASTTSSVSCGAPSSLPRDDAPHLRELFHQIRLRVQAAGGVDDHDVAAARLRRLDRVVGDGRGVAAARGADEVCAGALRPDLELLLGRRTERVGRRDDNREPVLRELRRELADRRRLPRAVDADDEDHARPLCDVQDARLAEQRGDLLAERRLRSPSSPRASSRRTSSAVASRRRRLDQRLLEPLPGEVVGGIECAAAAICS